MRLLRAGGEVELSRDAVAESVAFDGLVVIRGGGVGEVRDLLAGWTVAAGHPHEREKGLTIITPRSYAAEGDGLAGFSRLGLDPHTDRSLDVVPPSLVATVILSPGACGGETLLVDGAAVLAVLERSFGRSAVASLRLRTRDGATVPVVERFDGWARIRFRSDRVASVYSDTGDRSALEAWRAMVSRPTPVRLGVGDGYLVHNHRYLHGRTGFTGTRRLARLLATVDEGHHLSWLNMGFRVACP